MNILVTGGTGYIGSHTAAVLSRLGHNVVLLDNLSNSSEHVLDRLIKICGKPLPLIKGDIRETNLVKDSLSSHDINVVFHFAGLKAVGESVKKPLSYYSNNVQGTLSLLEAMQASTIKKLVFSSSATVYGQPQYLPLDEIHPTSATNPYGRSKLQIEEILHDIAESDPEWRIACLRYFNPVGAHESGLIGENSGGIPNNLMPYIAKVAAGQQAELNIFGDDYPTPDGTGVRDYIHVMDVADGHAAALSFIEKVCGWHAFNLGTGRGCSVFEIVKAYEKSSGRPVPCKVVDRRLGDVAEYYANPGKAKALWNWTAERSLEICVLPPGDSRKV
jgi:UDP-glucose 4-epimerase